MRFNGRYWVNAKNIQQPSISDSIQNDQSASSSVLVELSQTSTTEEQNN
jgi:hypothetical protein